MSTALRKGDRIASTTAVCASAEQVYDIVSDIRRIPEWSPECIRTEWTGPQQFRGTNRRRIGRWSTAARVITDDPGREFGFAVQMGGADFTTWVYRIVPTPQGCELSEEMTMCVDLPMLALLFERIALRVKDRRTDLKGNIDQSQRAIRRIAEASAGPDGVVLP